MTPQIYAGLGEWSKRLYLKSQKEHKELSEEKLKFIKEAACDVCGITMRDFKSKSRKRPIVMARRLVAFTLRKKYHISLITIAKTMLTHHATVMHHCTQLTNAIQINDKEQVELLNKFNEKIL